VNQLLALIVGEIATRIPTLAIDLAQILSKPDATDADWDNLRTRWQKSWDQKKTDAESRTGGV